jgi:hypothetical protein
MILLSNIGNIPCRDHDNKVLPAIILSCFQRPRAGIVRNAAALRAGGVLSPWCGGAKQGHEKNKYAFPMNYKKFLK